MRAPEHARGPRTHTPHRTPRIRAHERSLSLPLSLSRAHSPSGVSHDGLSARFDPLCLHVQHAPPRGGRDGGASSSSSSSPDAAPPSAALRSLAPLSSAVAALSLSAGAAHAAAGTIRAGAKEIDPFFSFTPVCPYSDGVFRGGQRLALLVAGNDNIEDYRPLINDVLIRVRTELCVLESFTRETAVPFLQEKGVGWVLPLHETSETYLAGVVFMVGANFILLGSTKVVAILAIYHDLVLGVSTRALAKLLGLAAVDEAARADREIEKLLEKQANEMKGVMSDRALGKDEREAATAALGARYAAQMEEVRSGADDAAAKRETSALGKAMGAASTLAIPIGLYGTLSKRLREVLELFDTFCSRYFVAVTVFYVVIKTAHFVLFPDLFAP